MQQNPYEVGGFVTSLICVWLNARERVWGWFWAIVSAVLSAKIFYDQRLFGDMYLQFFFVGSAIYGIYAWLYGGKQSTELEIRHTTATEWLAVVSSCLVCFGILVYALKSLKGDVVYMDALTTTLSLAGQIMLARKLIENWWIWIFANVLYVGLYGQKGLYLYTTLYAVFVVLAIYGLQSWTSSLKKGAK